MQLLLTTIHRSLTHRLYKTVTGSQLPSHGQSNSRSLTKGRCSPRQHSPDPVDIIAVRVHAKNCCFVMTVRPFMIPADANARFLRAVNKGIVSGWPQKPELMVFQCIGSNTKQPMMCKQSRAGSCSQEANAWPRFWPNLAKIPSDSIHNWV